jgi:hypothetical protein
MFFNWGAILTGMGGRVGDRRGGVQDAPFFITGLARYWRGRSLVRTDGIRDRGVVKGCACVVATRRSLILGALWGFSDHTAQGRRGFVGLQLLGPGLDPGLDGRPVRQGGGPASGIVEQEGLRPVLQCLCLSIE